MRFRRLGGRGPDFSEQRASPAPAAAGLRPAASRRRRAAARRILALLLVALLVAAFLFVEQSWLRADALVRGPTVVVEAVNKARIVEIYATCNRAVKAGDALVKLENETKGVAFDDTVRQLQSRKIELGGNVKVAAEEAAQARATHNGTLAVLAEKATVFNIHDRLFKEGVIPRTEWDLARVAYKEAEANALTAEAGWRTKQASYDRAEKQLLSDAKAIDTQLDVMRRSEEIQKVQILRAPKDGIVTKCDYLPGAVVDAGISVFVIFDPRESFVEAYFEPAAVERLKIGMKAELRMPGFARPLVLPITSIDPVITRRPEELTRYFWQREQWTQYQPVRFDLKALPPAELASVQYGAHAAVGFVFLPGWAEPFYRQAFGKPSAN
ncbi:MAG: HlyD family efflux transporter periplasmic adaptor subunit [Alphaproteobacteria bacterium]|nr:HlyD family efflux transporter periplasmic adaptor subunit [Alphaproteobacteria bacterium]